MIVVSLKYSYIPIIPKLVNVYWSLSGVLILVWKPLEQNKAVSPEDFLKFGDRVPLAFKLTGLPPIFLWVMIGR